MENVNIIGIIQARMNSSRLPGKVLLPLMGAPMILRQLERIKQCKKLDQILLATSTSTTDDPLVDIAEASGYEVYRGSLENVLDRFYCAATKYNANHVVRITGDCPLIDPNVIDQVVERHLEQKNDYTSNAMICSFPDGLDTEVITISALYQSVENARLPSELEHVTQYINKHPEIFKLGNFLCFKDLSHMRWTVDEPEDYDFVVNVFEELYLENPQFKMADVVKLLHDKPDLQKINSCFERNEGLQKSLLKDKEFIEYD